MALMNNEILQQATGSTSNYIQHIIKPFPLSKQFRNFENTADALFMCLLLG